MKKIVPGVDYYQVVFTMPEELSSLALGNRKVIFNLLFHTAWRSLKKVLADEQQYEAAASLVLHTWNQRLESHVHLHAVVPGYCSLAPKIDTRRWSVPHSKCRTFPSRSVMGSADERRSARPVPARLRNGPLRHHSM